MQGAWFQSLVPHAAWCSLKKTNKQAHTTSNNKSSQGLLSVYYGPGTTLSAFYLLTHLIFTTIEVGSLISSSLGLSSWPCWSSMTRKGWRRDLNLDHLTPQSMLLRGHMYGGTHGWCSGGPGPGCIWPTCSGLPGTFLVFNPPVLYPGNPLITLVESQVFPSLFCDCITVYASNVSQAYVTNPNLPGLCGVNTHISFTVYITSRNPS